MANGMAIPTADGRFTIKIKRGSISSSGFPGFSFDVTAWASMEISFAGRVTLPLVGDWEVGLVQYLASTTHRQQYDQGGSIFVQNSGFWLDTLDGQSDIWLNPSGAGLGLGVIKTSTSQSLSHINVRMTAIDQPAIVMPLLAIRDRCAKRVSETLLWVFHNMFFRAFVVARVAGGSLQEKAFPLLMSDEYGFELLFDASHPNIGDQDPFLTFKPMDGLPRSIKPSEFLPISRYSVALSPPDPWRANGVMGPLYAAGVSQYLGDCNTYMGPFNPDRMGIRVPAGT